MPQAVDEDLLRKKSVSNQPFNIVQPPMKNIPHLEFPKMLYMWPRDKKLSPSSKTTIANDAKEEKTLLAKGWRDKPHVQEFEEELPEGFEADLPGKAS